MSRARFGLLLALLVLVLGLGTFVVVLGQLDEDGPGDGDAAATTTAPPTTTTAPQGLATPTFVTVVFSEGDEASAQARVDQLVEQGYASGVLRSDDHTSLEPGFWVAYVGPFPDVPAAQAARDDLATNGYSAAYVRCVGTDEQCA